MGVMGDFLSVSCAIAEVILLGVSVQNSHILRCIIKKVYPGSEIPETENGQEIAEKAS